MALEVERKYRIAEWWTPPTGQVGMPIRQAYLTDPGSPLEIRVRAIGENLLMTAKARRTTDGCSAEVREEVEFPITAEAFEALWEMADKDAVHKRRWSMPVPGGVADVDVYEGSLAGLRVVEVELAGLEEAERFVPPDWFGDELTGRAGWSNRELARLGAPAGAENRSQDAPR
jgi:adenylate cyclase